MSKAKREAKKQAKKQKKQAAKRERLKKAKSKSKSMTKIKKKHWYFIIAPREFNERILGKTLVPEANVLVGRTIRTNLMEMTGDIKKQNTIITFKVSNIKDNKAATKVHKYELMNAAVKRLIRRNQDKIEWAFDVKTSNGESIKVKPLILTKYKSKRSARTKIIRSAEQILKEQFSKTTFSNIIKDLISFKIQSTMKRKLKKITPVRIFDIRFLGRVSSAKGEIKQEEAEEVKEKSPKVVDNPKKPEKNKGEN